MDYQQVDNYMKSKGWDKEPAFDFLYFLNEPIPPTEKKRILGLYFPEGEQPQNKYGYLPPSTIILPPDANTSTLLHELGHRHGHFYYNDISEEYAENWRKAHEGQGNMQPVMRAKSDVCSACPELAQGRKICPWCEFGDMPIPHISQRWENIGRIALSRSASRYVTLASDYSYDFTVTPPEMVTPGSPIQVKIYGDVVDKNAGDIDNWAVTVATALVDAKGNPDLNNRIFKTFGSDIYGINPSTGIWIPYSKKIALRDNVNAGNYNPSFGVMPNNPVTIWSELFACHTTSIPWDWSLWETTPPA